MLGLLFPNAQATPARLLFGMALLLVASLFFGYLGMIDAHRRRALATHGIQTEAIVVGLETRRGRRTSHYHPVAEFVTRDGRKMRAVIVNSVSQSDYVGGERVAIMYYAAQPDQPRFLSTVTDSGGSWLVLGISVVLLVAAGFRARRVLQAMA